MKLNSADQEIYLDHAAATPCREEVLQMMIPFFTEEFGNTNAAYRLGRRSRDAVESSRNMVADLLGARSSEIFFTSGSTESNNLAIRGVLSNGSDDNRHAVTATTEHPAVIETFRYLESRGVEVTYLGVDQYGSICIDELRNSIRPTTRLVSIMHANSEVGTIQDLALISRTVKEQNENTKVHSDAVASCGMLDVDVNALGVDLLTVASNKVYGPPGVALLFKREDILLNDKLFGGGQESGVRSGTHPVPLIVGMAEALSLAEGEREENVEKLLPIRNSLIEEIGKTAECTLNGHPENRLANNVHFSFAKLNGEDLVLELERSGIQASAGSACFSGSLEPSPVLTAMGQNREMALGSLRLTPGKSTTIDMVPYIVDSISKSVERLRLTSA